MDDTMKGCMIIVYCLFAMVLVFMGLHYLQTASVLELEAFSSQMSNLSTIENTSQEANRVREASTFQVDTYRYEGILMLAMACILLLYVIYEGFGVGNLIRSLAKKLKHS
jgi:hypothetical protein